MFWKPWEKSEISGSCIPYLKNCPGKFFKKNWKLKNFFSDFHEIWYAGSSQQIKRHVFQEFLKFLGSGTFFTYFLKNWKSWDFHGFFSDFHEIWYAGSSQLIKRHVFQEFLKFLGLGTFFTNFWKRFSWIQVLYWQININDYDWPMLGPCIGLGHVNMHNFGLKHIPQKSTLKKFGSILGKSFTIF